MMTLRSFPRYAACALLVLLCGGLTPASYGESPPPPNGSPKDVADKMDTGKKAAQAVSDGVTAGAKALGGKSDTVAPIAKAAGNTLKIVAVGAKILDSFDKGGAKGAAETAAVEGAKHVISGPVAAAATAAATTGLIAIGAGPVAVGVGAAVVGLGARHLVGKAVEAAGPYVNSAVTSVVNGVGETLADGGIDKVEGMANGTPTLVDYGAPARIQKEADDRQAAQDAADRQRAFRADVRQAIINGMPPPRPPQITSRPGGGCSGPCK